MIKVHVNQFPLRDISNTVTYEKVNTTRISPSKVLSEHQYVLNDKLHVSKKQKTKTNDKLNHIDHGYSCTKPKKIETSKIKQANTVPSVQERQNDTVDLNEDDSRDLDIIFNEIGKECPPKILEFLMSQKKAISSHPNGRRWNCNIIRLCLTLWCRSPKCYTDLRDSGFLVLPSQKLL